MCVQPVLCDHADVDRPKICLFAATNIPPFQELTYDYGKPMALTPHQHCKMASAWHDNANNQCNAP